MSRAGNREGSPTRPVTAGALLSGGLDRVRRTPRAVAGLLLAGLVVAGVDWLRLRGPVPATGYAGVTQGEISVAFGVLVDPGSRVGLPVDALVGLTGPWLAVTVGLELFAVAAVAVAGCDALGRLCDTEPPTAAVVRTGLVLAVTRLLGVEFQFAGGALVIGVVLLALVAGLFVRLVPLPGRLVLGERFRVALRRSWRSTRGYGWPLLGVVAAVGLMTHLCLSVPVLGPVLAGPVAAVHAGAVAAFLDRSGTLFSPPG